MSTPRVTIISESLARRYFPDADPIGQRLKQGGPDSANPYMEVVGVAGDLKYSGLAGRSEPVYYEASSQSPAEPMWLVVRTRPNGSLLPSALRAKIASIDPDVPVSQVSSLTNAMGESVSLPRFQSALIGLFAAIALLLASVGIYGVTAYLVVERTQEIGIRMALGASKTNVLGLVLGHTARLAFAGAILGIAGAFALGPALKTMLFGVSFHDPAIAVRFDSFSLW